MQRQQLRAHAVRFEVAFTGTANRSWCTGKDVEEIICVPFGIKWLHCEFTHCAEHQECVFEEEILRGQRSMVVVA